MLGSVTIGVPQAAARMGAAIVLCGGIVWMVFGPNSGVRTVAYAVVDRIDTEASGTSIHFLAPRYPTECSDPESNGLGLMVHSDVVPGDTCKPKAIGEVVLRIDHGHCNFVSFTPRKYGAR